MQFSEHWLRSFIDPPLDSGGLDERLTMGGLEVEARVPAAPPFSGVVVGRVLTVERHPQADRLTVCAVDVGQAEPLTIVCGAPNARVGLRVPCALEGAKLPGGLIIRRSNMRGIESQGMLCSASELGITDDASGLLELDASTPVGEDLRIALDLDDQCFTLKLTPNRADCLSIVGLAREVAALCALPFEAPASMPIATHGDSARRVRIENSEACPRFCARRIFGIDARAPTPAWMKQRLARSGVCSVSAIVDVTNYVMLEQGQPLHAYDDALLEGDVVVRFPKPGEQLTLLNGQTLDLEPDLLLVTDEVKPLGLAGIMGGAGSAIGDATTSVYLEGAFWNPVVIQGKARRLGFATDAGFRFERGVDFARAPAAVDRATELILEFCGGRAGPLTDVRGVLPRRDAIKLRPRRVSRLLGIETSVEFVAEVFTRLGFDHERTGDDFLVTPPSYRFDIAIEEDLVEEVARLYGYDRFPAVHRQQMLPAPEATRPLSTLRGRLVDRGYQEVITFGFVSSEYEQRLGLDASPIRVLNPIASQFDVMRPSLLGGLLETLRTNLNRKASRVRIFETGRCFLRTGERFEQPLRLAMLAYGPAATEQWGQDRRNVDFFDLKGDVESLVWPTALTTEAALHRALHPGRSARVLRAGEAIGWLGELHPRLVQVLDLPAAPMLAELELSPLLETALPRALAAARVPIVRRDLALVIDETLPAQQVLDALREAAPSYVVQLKLFDVYRGPNVGPGKKSLAILVLMQDTERTLTDPEIDAAIAVLLREAEKRFGGTLRK